MKTFMNYWFAISLSAMVIGIILNRLGKVNSGPEYAKIDKWCRETGGAVWLLSIFSLAIFFVVVMLTLASEGKFW